MPDWLSIGDIVAIIVAFVAVLGAWFKIGSRLDRVDDRFDHERELSELAVKQLKEETGKMDERLDKHLEAIYGELKGIQRQLNDYFQRKE